MGSQEQHTPFDIAKQSLQFVGKFQTPPTPEVFEVWYRYVEGTNDALLKALAHVVDDDGAVSSDHIAAIHTQFCQEESIGGEIGDSLANQIEQIQSVVASQKSAGARFDASLGSTSAKLQSAEHSSDELNRCVAELSSASTAMHEHLSEMSQRLEDSEKEIESLRQQLQESQRGMLTDHLTGIGNRRMFDRFVANFVSRKSSLSARMFVVLIDLDRFKAINDQHGHAAGDQVIQFLATSLTSQWPGIAFARLGGDEFAAFFECDDREDVVEFASDIKSHFASQELVLGRDQETIGHLQFSIGVALLRDNDTEQSWVNRADELLYEAKRLGRNRSVVEPVRHE